MAGPAFRCNLCGEAGVFDPQGDWREAPSCSTCGSSVRTRQLAYCLTSGLSGTAEVLPRVDGRAFKGIGLSDPDYLARRVADAFDYINTFYHQDPRLDICSPDQKWAESADFIISSDVFEHVPSPVQHAFDGAFRVLRSGGLLVLTVPFDGRPETTEHYPAVREFKTVEFEGEWLLIGRTASGTYGLHTNPIFHGGPGTTVEMRFFSRNAVLAHLENAGFVDIVVHDVSVPEFGIFLPHQEGLPITARKPVA